MTDQETQFDEVSEAIEDAAMAVAEAQIDAGGGIPHEIVGEWLRKLARGEVVRPDFLVD